jgi:hypothetical protein
MTGLPGRVRPTGWRLERVEPPAGWLDLLRVPGPQGARGDVQPVEGEAVHHGLADDPGSDAPGDRQASADEGDGHPLMGHLVAMLVDDRSDARASLGCRPRISPGTWWRHRPPILAGLLACRACLLACRARLLPLLADDGQPADAPLGCLAALVLGEPSHLDGKVHDLGLQPAPGDVPRHLTDRSNGTSR